MYTIFPSPTGVSIFLCRRELFRTDFIQYFRPLPGSLYFYTVSQMQDRFDKISVPYRGLYISILKNPLMSL